MKRFSSWLQTVAFALVCGFAFAADPMLVVGHKNPDTDAIVSAIAVAHLKTQMGVTAVPIAQGQPTPETKYVLERFQLTAPPVQTTVAGRQVFLVDHSDYPQAPDDLTKAEIVGMVDHHKLGGLTTDKPIEAWVFPVGCSGTIIARMYAVADVPIPQSIAGGMLSAILSDTLMFKSPTTTPEDRTTAAKLAMLAGVDDIQALGMKIFEAKSQFKGISAMGLLKQDFKAFNMSGRKVGVAQLEMMDLGMVSPMKNDLRKAMGELKADGYHSVLLMLTDIMKEGTELHALSDDAGIVETALGAKLQSGSVWLPGVVSRKKQVIPGLEKAFK
ncbi:MAG: manganese-dependent inorganic pyrophosphatase [Rhodocyclaceae bacterium]|nr:MAG: manganese-dependent inorganic pyrophosphatase [Rhodocyclaceae bacterium]TND02559.1 MAG: manganese-dependent inorganic pyrophosphatase [Rhodocyclaceae bacterium]